MDHEIHNRNIRLQEHLHLPDGSYSINYNRTMKLKNLNKRRSETKSKLFSINVDHSFSHDFSFDPFYNYKKTYNNLLIDLDGVRKWMKDFETIDIQSVRTLYTLTNDEQNQLMLINKEKKDDVKLASRILNDMISLLTVLLDKPNELNHEQEEDIPLELLRTLHMEALTIREDCSKIWLGILEIEILLLSRFKDTQETFDNNLGHYSLFGMSEDCLAPTPSKYHDVPSSSLGSSLQTLKNNFLSSTTRSSNSPESIKKNSGCYMQDTDSFNNISRKYKFNRMYRSASLNLNQDSGFVRSNLNYSRFSDGTFSTFHLYKGKNNSTTHDNVEETIESPQHLCRDENNQDLFIMRQSRHFSRPDVAYDNQAHKHSFYDEFSADADRSDCSSLRVKKSRRRTSYIDKGYNLSPVKGPFRRINKSMITPKRRNTTSSAKYLSYNRDLDFQGNVGCDSSDVSISSNDDYLARELAEKMDRHLQMKNLARIHKKCQHCLKSDNRLVHDDESRNISEPSSYISQEDDDSLPIEDIEDEDVSNEIYDNQEVNSPTQKSMTKMRRGRLRCLKGSKALNNTDSSLPGMAWDTDQYQVYTNSTEQDLSGSCLKLLSQFEDYSWDEKLSDISLRDACFDGNTPGGEATIKQSELPIRSSPPSTYHHPYHSNRSSKINYGNNELDETMTPLADSPTTILNKSNKIDSSTMTDMDASLSYYFEQRKMAKTTDNLANIKSNTQTTSGYTSDLDSPPRSFSQSSTPAEDMKFIMKTYKSHDKTIQTDSSSSPIYYQGNHQSEMEICDELNLLFNSWSKMNSLLNLELSYSPMERKKQDLKDLFSHSKDWLETCDVSKRRLNQILSSYIKQITLNDPNKLASSASNREVIFQHMKDINTLIDHFDLLYLRIHNFMNPLLEKKLDSKNCNKTCDESDMTLDTLETKTTKVTSSKLRKNFTFLFLFGMTVYLLCYTIPNYLTKDHSTCPSRVFRRSISLLSSASNDAKLPNSTFFPVTQ